MKIIMYLQRLEKQDYQKKIIGRTSLETPLKHEWQTHK